MIAIHIHFFRNLDMIWLIAMVLFLEHVWRATQQLFVELLEHFRLVYCFIFYIIYSTYCFIFLISKVFTHNYVESLGNKHVIGQLQS